MRDHTSLAAAARRSLDLVGNLLGNVDRLVASVESDASQIARDSDALLRAAGAQLRMLENSVRAAPRLARIVRDGAQIAASYRIHRARSVHADPARAAERLGHLHDVNATRLSNLCMELGGGVLKLGQFLSCRRDLLPAAYAQRLSALQDSAPSVSIEDIYARIETELGAPVGELYETFEPDPIGTASLAQVHRATLPGGRPVAVKVQLPNIEHIIDLDLAALAALSGTLSEVMPHTDVQTLCRELSRSIRGELDYCAEADNMRRFSADVGGRGDVLVPAVIASHSTPRVLTMELVEGRRLTEFLDDAEPRERARLLDIFLRCFFRQLIDTGRFHADPHPGNFLVLPGPRLAVLDFGSVTELSPGVRLAYVGLIAAAAARDQARMASLLAELGFRAHDDDPKSLVELARLMLEPLREGSRLIDIDAAAQLAEMMQQLADNPIAVVPAHFVQVGRVFTAIGGLLLHYRPDVDVFAALTGR